MINLYKNLPTIDLHGFDREYAKYKINEFINDNYSMRNYKLVIVHGIGQGILKKATQEVLRKNKLVEEYKIDNFNDGSTIVILRKRV